MRCGLRFKLLVSVTLLIVSIILMLILEDKCETYDPVSFLVASLTGEDGGDYHRSGPNGIEVGDKIIVVPILDTQNASWVATDLPDWQRAIYLVNPSTDEQRANSLTTPMNKGHEAMAYLTYIVDNYERNIPSIVAFLHAHRDGFFAAWHVDTPLHDNVVAMRNLQLDYVKEQGYVNLRCNLNPGCKKINSKANSHVTAGVWDEIFYGTSTPVFQPGASGPAAVAGVAPFEEYEHNLAKPLGIWTPCCAQFAVSREQIHKRPLSDYVHFRQWLMDTELDDAKSGRVWEYLWHVIFGKEAMHCPDQKTCYCRLYGHCN